jgi:MFS family permease
VTLLLWIAACALLLLALSFVYGALAARALPAALPVTRPRVTVLLPVRDEVGRIEATIQRLLAQRGVDLELIVADDRSTDGTSALLARLAAGEPRLRVIRIDDVPPGWLGKTNALAQAARQVTGDWILLTDGDAWLADDVVARAVAAAERDGADHLCLAPSHAVTTPIARGVLLLLHGSLARRFARVNAGRSYVGIGAFNLLRRETYERIGGHAPLRMEVVDDVKLGLLVREAGGRTIARHSPGAVVVDWGSSVPRFLHVVEKNLFAIVEFSATAALLLSLAMLGVWVAALLGPFDGSTAGWAAAAMLLAVAPAAALLAPWVGLPWRSGLLAPLLLPMLPIALLRSMVVTLWQNGVTWRGTHYPLAELRAGMVQAANTRVPGSGSVFTNRSLSGLTVSQFLGAFNDNLFKQVVLLLAARVLFHDDKQGIATVVFSLPFVLFSGLAGDVSERFSKRSLIVGMKLWEAAIMLLSMVALGMQSWAFLLIVLFVLGTQSAFFGPPKYGSLPEIVQPGGLIAANGLISMTTFLAILLGMSLAGPLISNYLDQIWVTGAIGTLLAVAGALAALRITPLAPQQPKLRVGWNPFGSMPRRILELRREGQLFAVVVAYSIFWFNGGVVQQVVNGMGEKGCLDLPIEATWKLSVLLAVLAVAIICGSLLAAPLARRVAPYRIVAAGAAVMVPAQVSLALIGPVFDPAFGYAFAIVALAVLGCAGALFVVPIVTYIQDAPRRGEKGQVFAVTNFLNFVFILLSGAFYLVAKALSLAAPAAGALSALLMGGYLFQQRRALGSIAIGRALPERVAAPA